MYQLNNHNKIYSNVTADMDKNKDYENIPRTVEDPHYRYKMPILTVKIEGRGNGVKTRLPNIIEIAKALERDISYIMKFFELELGTKTINNGGYMLNGKHEPEIIADVLDRFIEKYILCGKCHNPETVILAKKDNVRLKCKACGNRTQCDVSHKISTYIIRNPPIDVAAEEKKKKEAEEDELYTDRSSKVFTTAEEDELENDWAVPTDPESVATREFNLRGGSLNIIDCDDELSPNIQKITPTENPLPFLGAFWDENPSDKIVLDSLDIVVKLCDWKDDVLLKNVFGSQWLKFTPKNAIRKAHYLSLLIDSKKDEKLVLNLMEKMAMESKDFALRFADILALFWEENVLDEDSIRNWHKTPNPKVPAKVSKLLRASSQPVLKWLDQEKDEVGLPFIQY